MIKEMINDNIINFTAKDVKTSFDKKYIEFTLEPKKVGSKQVDNLIKILGKALKTLLK